MDGPVSGQLLGPAFDTPEFYLGDPNATFQHLRRTDPLHWYEAGNFWVVTTYADVKAISAHPNKFSSERIGILMDLVASREGRDPQAIAAAASCSWIRPSTDNTEKQWDRASPPPRWPSSNTAYEK